MGLLNKIKEFLHKKRTEIINSSFKSLQLMEREWHKFLNKDVYLTYLEKEQFNQIISRKETLIKTPWYLFFDSKLKKIIDDNLDRLHKYPKIIDSYNEEFLKIKIKEYNHLFKKSSYQLDENQKRAIIKDDKHNLIVAGAGSGKTETLLTRIAYLINRKSDRIKPKRILALSFQNKTADELRDRLNKKYNVDVEIKTFHSLGKKILDDYSKTSKTKPLKLKFGGDNADRNYARYIEELFKKTEKKLHDKLLDYLKHYCEDEVEKQEKDFEENLKVEYYEYRRNLEYTALDGTKVKSLAERDILNLFLTHNINGKRIDVSYESPALWMKYQDKNGNEKIPKPDFYFKEFEIYLEHWAVDENGKVPAWFEGDYLHTMNLKKEKFKGQSQYTLVETSHKDTQKDNFEETIKERMLETLRKKFPNQEFNFEKLSYEKIVERVWSSAKDALKVLSENIGHFIWVAKTYNLSPSEVKKNVYSGRWSNKQKAFSEVAVDIYELYQNELNKSNEIDFADMINLSIKQLQLNPELYKDVFDHILIDEYQDISTQRYNLIQELMRKNFNCKLFCVGDDWQSIMGFTGSNLDLFVNFQDYFEHPERTDLTINYRSIKSIVDTGAEIIKHNKLQIQKEAFASDKTEHPIIVFGSNYKNSNINDTLKYYDDVAEHCISKIKDLHDNKGYAWGDIMILRRINPPTNWMTMSLYKKAREAEVPLSDDVQDPTTVSLITVHKSKGLQARIVFILNVDKGLYGFPNELQSPDILEPATRGKRVNKEEEERRLFYVAMTRAREDVVVYHQKCAKSGFLDEIKTHIKEEDISIVESPMEQKPLKTKIP